MICPNPIPFEALTSWWLNEASDTEASAVEEHLFACDHCAAACERLARVVGSLKAMIPPVISAERRDRLLRSGFRIRHTPVEAGVDARARFSQDVDLLVHVLRADLSRAERVDVEVVKPDGSTYLMLEHVPFRGPSGEILVACQRHYRDEGDPVFRVFAFEDGARRVVGEYFVRHEWL